MTSSLKNSNCWIQPSSTSSAGAPASKFSGAKGNLIVVLSTKESLHDLKDCSSSTHSTDSTEHQHLLYSSRNQSFGGVAMCCGRLYFHFGTTMTRWLGFIGFVSVSHHSGPDQPTPFEADGFQRLHETRIPPGDSGPGTATSVLNLRSDSLRITWLELNYV